MGCFLSSSEMFAIEAEIQGFCRKLVDKYYEFIMMHILPIYISESACLNV